MSKVFAWLWAQDVSPPPAIYTQSNGTHSRRAAQTECVSTMFAASDMSFRTEATQPKPEEAASYHVFLTDLQVE